MCPHARRLACADKAIERQLDQAPRSDQSPSRRGPSKVSLCVEGRKDLDKLGFFSKKRIRNFLISYFLKLGFSRLQAFAKVCQDL
jgi:hypothetical protein